MSRKDGTWYASRTMGESNFVLCDPRRCGELFRKGGVSHTRSEGQECKRREGKWDGGGNSTSGLDTIRDWRLRRPGVGGGDNSDGGETAMTKARRGEEGMWAREFRQQHRGVMHVFSKCLQWLHQ